MDMLHLVQLQDVPWQAHPTIAGVMTKVVENRASLPQADALLAQVAPGGAIPWHVHEVASETVYVVQGEGVILCAPAKDETQSALEAPIAQGSALTVRAGVWHSVVNRGKEPIILFAFHVPPTL